MLPMQPVPRALVGRHRGIDVDWGEGIDAKAGMHGDLGGSNLYSNSAGCNMLGYGVNALCGGWCGWVRNTANCRAHTH